jgi:myosin heavy subunit
VIDLISKKPGGLLILLEEHGMLARKPDNKALLSAYNQTHVGKSEAYARPRFQADSFIVKHFAGEVTYGIAGWLEKNNDALNDTLLSAINNSGNPFVANVSWACARTRTPSPHTTPVCFLLE